MYAQLEISKFKNFSKVGYVYNNFEKVHQHNFFKIFEEMVVVELLNITHSFNDKYN